MTFKDLINDSTWDCVRHELLKKYPDVIDVIDSFEQVYNKLKKLKPVQSKIKIKVQKVNYTDNDNDEFVTVSGIGNSHDFGSFYDISATNWKEWLGMKIERNTINNFDQNQIVSNCLYEMTFLGFSQVEIENRLKEYK